MTNDWRPATAQDAAVLADLATVARAGSDGSVAGFVLGHGRVELGPIGTVPEWRGRGVGSALLAAMLVRCRGREVRLTVDGESPTRAQNFYLRNGFRITERLAAYHVQIS